MPLAPAPADFLNVAVEPFVNGPGLLALVIDASLWQSQVPLFVIVAPLLTWMLPVPAHVVVPLVVRTRENVRDFVLAPVIEIPPFAFVVPASRIAPDVQVVRPDTVIVSVPRSVPPETVSVVGVIVSPLEKFAVPPLTTRELPTLVTVANGSKVTVPPLTVVPDVAA